MILYLIYKYKYRQNMKHFKYKSLNCRFWKKTVPPRLGTCLTETFIISFYRLLSHTIKTLRFNDMY